MSKLKGYKKSVVLWFGKEVGYREVKNLVISLRNFGLSVVTPFYIGYELNSEIVTKYLEDNLKNSDALYVIGKEGSILEHIIEYAKQENKQIVYLESQVMSACQS